MKKCCKCKEERKLNYFSKDSNKNSGYKYYCKICESIMKKKYYEKKKIKKSFLENNI